MLDALVAVSGHRLGVLCFEQVGPKRHWERDEVAFACQLADKIALSMVNRARREALETLRASEERFAGAFEQAPIGIALLTPEGRFFKVNRALCDLVGYTEADLLTRTFDEITHPEDIDPGLAHLRRLLQGEVTTFQMEKRYRHAQGHWVAALLSASLVRDRKGAPSYLIGQIQDVTERKEAQKQLENSLKEKEALLQEVHHRVKNNLQVIASLLRLESSRSPEPGTKAVLKDMQGRILAMALLHEALYRTGDFGQAELGSYLKQIAEQFVRAQTPVSGRIRLDLDLQTISVGIDQAIPCGLILNELLTNSFKHGFATGQGGVVRVELRRLEDGQGQLTVSDDGTGLAPDFATRQHKSLGLQLISDLARQIGGRLDVGPGPGASFLVTFAIENPRSTGGTPRPPTGSIPGSDRLGDP